MNQEILAIGFGLVTASILALSAVGFTLQFGVTNIFNLAFGHVMTVSAFVAYVVNVDARLGIGFALAAGAATGAISSVLINRLIYRPFLLRGATLFTMVIVTLATGAILLNALQIVVGTDFHSYTIVQQSSVHFLGMIFTPRQLLIIGLAAGSMLALHGVLRHTRLGKAMRATQVNAELARSCGIATDLVTDVAWLVSGAFCGLAGVALALNLSAFSFTFGNDFLLVIVACAVLGSVGHVYGALVGAVVIGLASEEAAIVAPDLKQVVAFAILVLILLARPNGLFSRTFTQQMSVSAQQ
jgi:branched-chain amino acid transport system permease protein/neutral amino acid transport system permease protein